jgi:hypothetical protein
MLVDRQTTLIKGEALWIYTIWIHVWMRLLAKMSFFLHGQCHLFAIALKRLTGLPLAGVLDFDAEYLTTYLMHAFVEVNDDLILDVAGIRSSESMMKDFMYWDPEPCNFAEKELLKWEGGKRDLDEEANTSLNKALAVAAEILAIENQMAAI